MIRACSERADATDMKRLIAIFLITASSTIAIGAEKSGVEVTPDACAEAIAIVRERSSASRAVILEAKERVRRCEARADALAKQALALYRSGDYAKAATRFVEAFEVSGRPIPLRNAAKAFEAAGLVEEAIGRWRMLRALEEASAEDRSEAEQRLAELTPASPPPSPPSERSAVEPAEGQPLREQPPPPLVPEPPPIRPELGDAKLAQAQPTSGETDSILSSGWFWVVVGAIAVAGVGTTLLLARGGSTSGSFVPESDLGYSSISEWRRTQK
jgi:tetratricopeptide (TPR) repeat protein